MPDDIIADFDVKLTLDEGESQEQDEEEEGAFIEFKRSHFDLCIRANGKAELYFHSYFWTTYLTSLLVVCG